MTEAQTFFTTWGKRSCQWEECSRGKREEKAKGHSVAPVRLACFRTDPLWRHAAPWEAGRCRYLRCRASRRALSRITHADCRSYPRPPSGCAAPHEGLDADPSGQLVLDPRHWATDVCSGASPCSPAALLLITDALPHGNCLRFVVPPWDSRDLSRLS